MALTSQPIATSTAKATQVFDTAELMEAILLHLGTRDVLKAMQVNRAMRDTVDGSIKIQTSIGLLPDWDADFLALPWTDLKRKRDAYAQSFHGLRYDDYNERYCSAWDRRYDDVHMGWVPDPRELMDADFRIFSLSNTCLYKLGSRCRSLTRCQPPVKEMEVYEYCDHCEEGDCLDIPNKVGKLTASNGT